MSVYRTSAGASCPRCRNVLARETDGELRCTQNGCGTWLPKKLVDDIVGMDAVARSKGNPFRATPLRPTKCLVCKQPLNDLYKGAHDVLTIGQCVEHGIWIERSSRSDLEALFAPERRAREAAAAREAELAKLDPVDQLALRVEQLEKVVSQLQAEISSLKSRL
ncbi:MAG: hypothetical protein JNL83_12655 [Myxococcales bacterium]|nr:hypothetical protein [Myxococcales bacterium]